MVEYCLELLQTALYVEEVLYQPTAALRIMAVMIKSCQ